MKSQAINVFYADFAKNIQKKYWKKKSNEYMMLVDRSGIVLQICSEGSVGKVLSFMKLAKFCAMVFSFGMLVVTAYPAGGCALL